ncbi:hypothetical protein [Kutzneria sp. 744]|nr:hypothetical protein [Kutzneria sp. 744]
MIGLLRLNGHSDRGRSALLAGLVSAQLPAIALSSQSDCLR